MFFFLNLSSVTYRSPSTLVLKYNLSMIFFPDCDDPLVSSEDTQPQCGLAPRSLAKVQFGTFEISKLIMFSTSACLETNQE